jgi:hypothetical protein
VEHRQQENKGAEVVEQRSRGCGAKELRGCGASSARARLLQHACFNAFWPRNCISNYSGLVYTASIRRMKGSQ